MRVGSQMAPMPRHKGLMEQGFCEQSSYVIRVSEIYKVKIQVNYVRSTVAILIINYLYFPSNTEKRDGSHILYLKFWS